MTFTSFEAMMVFVSSNIWVIKFLSSSSSIQFFQLQRFGFGFSFVNFSCFSTSKPLNRVYFWSSLFCLSSSSPINIHHLHQIFSSWKSGAIVLQYLRVITVGFDMSLISDGVPLSWSSYPRWTLLKPTKNNVCFCLNS